MWVNSTVSIAFGSMPAAARLALHETGGRSHVIARAGIDQRHAAF
jgi:hypothetical protein